MLSARQRHTLKASRASKANGSNNRYDDLVDQSVGPTPRMSADSCWSRDSNFSKRAQNETTERTTTNLQSLFKISQLKKIPKAIMKRYKALLKVFDFSKIILNKKVSTLEKGNHFGELALDSNQKRQASVKCATDVFAAYLERKEYF